MDDLLASPWMGQLMGLVVQVLFSALMVVVGLAFMTLDKKLKASLSAENYKLISAVTHQFVLAAEQAGVSGQIEAVGEAKKEMVMAMLVRFAAEKGLQVSEEELSAYVEAAVAATFK